MKLADLKRARRILIYGLGREGLSTRRFLVKHIPGAKIALRDDARKGASPDLKKFDVIVASPGIASEKFRGVARQAITSNARIFFDNLPEEARRKVIGVSGTKGKSTTAKFCGELLARAGWRVRVGGNIGVPLLDLFEELISGKLDFVVAELSSYQLERLKSSPGIALFLNIYPEHLNRHGTFARYLDAKRHLWKFQKPGDLLLIPRKWESLAIGKSKPASKIVACPPAPLEVFPAASTLASAHFRDNLGTVWRLAQLLKIDRGTFIDTAKRFRELPYRLEHFATKRGVRFYDDSLSTNPDSAIAAVTLFGAKLGALIIGGQDRKQSFDKLAQAVKKTGAWAIILDSETADRIERAFAKLDYRKLVKAATMNAAVRAAAENSPRGSAVVLSPAAPSYDRFKNYEEKGSAFKRAARRLK